VTLAALFAALAQTFNQADDTFVSRFAENLDRVFFELHHKSSLIGVGLTAMPR
jgi:hypothetical protein